LEKKNICRWKTGDPEKWDGKENEPGQPAIGVDKENTYQWIQLDLRIGHVKLSATNKLGAMIKQRNQTAVHLMPGSDRVFGNRIGVWTWKLWEEYLARDVPGISRTATPRENQPYSERKKSSDDWETYWVVVIPCLNSRVQCWQSTIVYRNTANRHTILAQTVPM
jgi:hypothetical protein